MIYFIVLYLLYLLSEKMIIINQKDSDFSKKIKTLARLFVIMFVLLNFYGYCVSNVIYSCVLIYIISFIKNDEIKDFLDTFNFYKEGFQSENNDMIFRRKIPDIKNGRSVNQHYVIDSDQLNSLEETNNQYSRFELAAIKNILENRLWITNDDNKMRINIEDRINLEKKREGNRRRRRRNSKTSKIYFLLY